MSSPPTKRRRTVTHAKAVTDPTIIKVKDTLKQNVDYFLDNIGSIVKKYTEFKEQAKPPEVIGRVIVRSEPLEMPTSGTTRIAAAADESSSPGAASKERTRDEVTDTSREDAKDAKKEETKDKNAVYVTFPDNSQLISCLQVIKREAYELSTMYDGIYDWIVLNLPDLKEEDTTGLEIKSAVMEQVASLADTIRGAYRLETKYFSERAESEKLILKMPECTTLQLSLIATDEDTWVEVGRAWRVMIRSCLILYALLKKNMTKLLEPVDGTKKTSLSYYQ